MTEPQQESDSTLHDDPVAARPRAPNDAYLSVISCPEAACVGTRIQLSEEEALLVGRRVERGGVALDDQRLSRVHARVVWDGRVGSFRVADLDSANGTFVDGRRIRVATLRPGSVIRVGNTLFVFAVRDLSAELEQRLSQVAGADASVLLLGESGTGKELAARRLHELSGRTGAFVAVNAAALPRELLASELFGHSRGAFSGARDERSGLFRAADGGSLFLDEIGDFPLDVQPALLRVLEERGVRAVGSERVHPVNVRLICATHHDLRARVAGGAFRLDLHARLAEVELQVAALRERRQALPALIAALAQTHGLGAVSVTPDAMETLALYEFPQNVRELKNLLARLKIFGTPPYQLDVPFLEREASHFLLSAREADEDEAAGLASNSPEITRDKLVALLTEHGNKVATVAEELKTSRTQVYRWLKRFGIETPSNRA